MVVEVSEAIAVELSIAYVVSRAKWTPRYDVRVYAADSMMKVFYYGVVQQSTGEDWLDAQLTLSTAQPAIGGAVPELVVHKIGFKSKLGYVVTLLHVTITLRLPVWTASHAMYSLIECHCECVPPLCVLVFVCESELMNFSVNRTFVQLFVVVFWHVRSCLTLDLMLCEFLLSTAELTCFDNRSYVTLEGSKVACELMQLPCGNRKHGV